jgi:hypothetical protein
MRRGFLTPRSGGYDPLVRRALRIVVVIAGVVATAFGLLDCVRIRGRYSELTDRVTTHTRFEPERALRWPAVALLPGGIALVAVGVWPRRTRPGGAPPAATPPGS